MNQKFTRSTAALAFLVSLALADPAMGGAVITSFGNYTSDAVYASWQTARITSSATNFVVTAKGYGSNWKYLGRTPAAGAGNTTLQVTVDLSADNPAADGKLGVMVELVDADGSDYTYAWYGLTLGHHVLTIAVTTPAKITAPGTVAGLDLNTLTHEHLQVDPSTYDGEYTVAWDDLSLTGAPSAPTPPPQK